MRSSPPRTRCRKGRDTWGCWRSLASSPSSSWWRQKHRGCYLKKRLDQEQSQAIFFFVKKCILFHGQFQNFQEDQNLFRRKAFVKFLWFNVKPKWRERQQAIFPCNVLKIPLACNVSEKGIIDQSPNKDILWKFIFEENSYILNIFHILLTNSSLGYICNW